MVRVFVTLLLLLVGCGVAKAHDLTVSDVSVVDVLNGKVLSNHHIGITKGKITYLGPDPVEAQQIIQGAGRWAIPGLWDMHVHISDPSFFPLFLANGVVGVRDMGGSAENGSDGCESAAGQILKAWRSQILRGLLQGPEIVMAGQVLSGTGSRSSLAAHTPQLARQAVSSVVSAGADFVKVYEDIPLDALLAISNEAKKQNVPFAGHVSEETLRAIDAVRAGQRSVEHVRSNLLVCFAESEDQLQRFFESDHWSAQDRQWAEPHIRSCSDLWKELPNSQTWLTPTLAVQETLELAGSDGFESDPRRITLPQSIIQSVVDRSRSLRQRTPDELKEVRNWNRHIHRFVNRANGFGVKLLAGSDAACEGTLPGYSLHRELELLRDAGLTSLQALQTATLEPANYLGRSDRAGRLERGFDADIVLIDGDPLENISNSRLVSGLIIDGRVVAIE